MILTNNIYTFEGMDGAGKRTQSLKLQKALGGEVVSFPQYDTITGKLVKSYLTKLGQRDASNLDMVKHDSAIYTLDRVRWFMYHTEYEKGPIIFDRYYTSNILFQTLHLSEDDKKAYIDWLIELEIETCKLPQPDKIFVLVVDPQVSLENIRKRNRETDFFETEQSLIRVYENAQWLSEYLGWELIQCDNGHTMRDEEDIHHEIISHIK